MIRYLFIFSLHWSYIDLAFLDISKRLKADPEQTQANLLKTQEFVNWKLFLNLRSFDKITCKSCPKLIFSLNSSQSASAGKCPKSMYTRTLPCWIEATWLLLLPPEILAWKNQARNFGLKNWPEYRARNFRLKSYLGSQMNRPLLSKGSIHIKESLYLLLPSVSRNHLRCDSIIRQLILF